MSNQPHTLIEALNRVLANSFALYLKSKNFHWHVSGPHFRDYHLLLDEQALQILAITDPIAERIRKRGGTTIRSIGHISRLQTLKDNDQLTVDAQAMLSELRADNESLIESFRVARALAEKEEDNASSSLLDDWVDEAEERVWFLKQAADVPEDAVVMVSHPQAAVRVPSGATTSQLVPNRSLPSLLSFDSEQEERGQPSA